MGHEIVEFRAVQAELEGVRRVAFEFEGLRREMKRLAKEEFIMK